MQVSVRVAGEQAGWADRRNVRSTPFTVCEQSSQLSDTMQGFQWPQGIFGTPDLRVETCSGLANACLSADCLQVSLTSVGMHPCGLSPSLVPQLGASGGDPADQS